MKGIYSNDDKGMPFDTLQVQGEKRQRALGIARVCCGEVTTWHRSDMRVYSFGGVHCNGWQTEEAAAVAYCLHHNIPLDGE
jgi:hypothetical protein